MADTDNLERLLLDMKESLEREIRHGAGSLEALRQEMRNGFAQVTTRFDVQAARLDRHAAL